MVTLQDPSKIKVHTWYNTGSQGNYINEYGTEGRSLYSADRAKSASFRVEREDRLDILENNEFVETSNGKSKLYKIYFNLTFVLLIIEIIISPT